MREKKEMDRKKQMWIKRDAKERRIESERDRNVDKKKVWEGGKTMWPENDH